MKWQSLEHFLSMGGRGLYVWGSYAVAVIVVVLELVLLRTRTRAARRQAGAPRPGDDEH
jgi:heme exporter protein D